MFLKGEALSVVGVVHTPYLITNRSVRHQVRRQFIFKVPGPGVGPFPHQQLHRFHLSLMILQGADDVQRCVSTERLKNRDTFEGLKEVHRFSHKIYQVASH